VPWNELQERRQRAFQVAVETRAFEIELFWKRSTFFWAFNAVAFAGFAALANEGALELSIFVASFGLVASASWAFVNLGSKLWYENWEVKVRRLEPTVVGDLFRTIERGSPAACWIVRPRRFSVSKITILLSYYVTGLWAAALGFQTTDVFVCADTQAQVLKWGTVGFAGASAFFIVVIGWIGRTHDGAP